jgi:hypothetical protein
VLCQSVEQEQRQGGAGTVKQQQHCDTDESEQGRPNTSTLRERGRGWGREEEVGQEVCQRMGDRGVDRASRVGGARDGGREAQQQTYTTVGECELHDLLAKNNDRLKETPAPFRRAPVKQSRHSSPFTHTHTPHTPMHSPGCL